MRKIIILLLLVPCLMQAQVKISELPTYTGSAENGYAPVTIGAATYKVFGKQFAAGKLDSIQIVSMAYPAADSIFEWKVGVRKFKGLLPKFIDTLNATRREIYSIRTLPTIGADANYFISSPTDTSLQGRLLILYNANTSAFVYTPTGAPLKEADGTTISTIPNNTLSIFLWNGSAFIRFSTGGAPGGAPDPYTAGYGIDPIKLLSKIIELDTSSIPKQSITLIRTGDSAYVEVDGVATSKIYLNPTIANSTDTGTYKPVAVSADFKTFKRLDRWPGSGGGIWGSITGILSSQTDLQSALNAKQATLVSGTNIKTINGNSVLGTGDLAVGGSSAWGSITGTLSSQTDLQSALNSKQATLVSGTNIKTINGSSVLGIGDLTVGGNPAGSNKQIQYNNSGSFGGEALFEYDPVTNTLTADTAYFQRLKLLWDQVGFDASKDTALSFDRITGQIRKTLAGGDRLVNGETKIKIMAGIIRPTIPGSIGQSIKYEWLYPSTGHDTIFFSAPIEVTSTFWKIFYPTMRYVNTFIPKADDQFVADNFTIGASVGLSDASLVPVRPQTLGGNSGYLRGNGTTWAQNGFATAITFDWTSGKLSLNANATMHGVNYQAAQMTYEGDKPYKLVRQLSGLGSYNVAWQFQDGFGNNVSFTPQTTDIVSVMIPGFANSTMNIYNRTAATDEMITNTSAVFVFGLFQELDNPHRLYGSMSATSVTTTGMTVNWPAVTTGSGTYTLERSTTYNFNTSSVVYTGTATSFTDSGLTTGTTYYYRVRHQRTSDSALSDMLFLQQATN